ncbi:hypothetical protein AA0114_g12008 [Alternaria tenuissima]|jgi:hypothetical protein|uniref:Uncharacterized protein n=1 Tax=Alternaria tenuissima TaxID=119927 RepID=A0A4V1WL58_9PLEO|nr:hypothetical protein AA0114_g12008 [Alternaria tenuissima]
MTNRDVQEELRNVIQAAQDLMDETDAVEAAREVDNVVVFSAGMMRPDDAVVMVVDRDIFPDDKP